MRAVLIIFMAIAPILFFSPELIGKTSIDSGGNLTPCPPSVPARAGSPKERGAVNMEDRGNNQSVEFKSLSLGEGFRVRLISPRHPLLKQIILNKLPIFHENKRITAATLAILLGPFGVHRLYLGTDPRVPIGYTITLGGCLYIVPLIDAGVILFSKDLSKFQNNPKFFMWAE